MAANPGQAGWNAPAADVMFGDVFEAPWLLDLFVRDDAALLGGGELSEQLVPKLGKWMNTELEKRAIDLYSPEFTPKEADRYALGHASFRPDADTHRAIILSDSCLVATALAQGRAGRRVSGRLLLAPVREVAEEDWGRLREGGDFGRFPLPPSDRLPGLCVAELRHAFMVDAVRLAEHTGARILACDAPLAEDLEVYWNAYAVRRGPLAYERNTLKLASLLSGGGEPAEEHEAAADTVAAVLDCAWQLEGADLEDVSEADAAVRFANADAGALTPDLRRCLAERLRELSGLAAAAADALEDRPPAAAQ